MTRVLLAAALALVGVPALAGEPVRLALFIGQNIGDPQDEALAYAERDAERMFDVLTTLGDVSRDRAYLVLDATEAKIRQALDELRGRAAELVKFGREPILFIYVSSHADERGLRLGPGRLEHAELRRLVDAVPGRIKVLVIDACAAGALIRDKGGRTVPPFEIDLEQGDDIQGRVVLTSTGAGEPAQEWEALGGSLFTHHLLSALRGAADRDGDGRVTLGEAYAYAYDRTLVASVGARAGLQHPWQEIDLRGRGELVLTRPGGRDEGIILGSTLAGHYVISAALSGDLVAAADKVSGRAVRLALPAGRYIVRKPEGRFVRVGEVVVLPGGTVELSDHQMQSVPYTDVARRGGHLSVRPHAVELGVGAATAVLAGGGLVPRVGVELRRESGPWELAAGAAVARGSLRGEQLTVSETDVTAAVQLRWRWPVGFALPYAGVRVGGGWAHQSLARDDEATIQRVFGVPPVPSRDGALAFAQLAVGGQASLSARTFARVELDGGILFARMIDGWAARPGADVRAALGWTW